MITLQGRGGDAWGQQLATVLEASLTAGGGPKSPGLWYTTLIDSSCHDATGPVHQHPVLQASIDEKAHVMMLLALCCKQAFIMP